MHRRALVTAVRASLARATTAVPVPALVPRALAASPARLGLDAFHGSFVARSWASKAEEPASSSAAAADGAGGDGEGEQEEESELATLQRLYVEKEEEAKQLKDALMRALAETENVRARGQRQTEDTKKFAVQGFAKELLDVADNLTRATAAVPEDAATSHPAKHLAALKDGVMAVEQILHQIFKRNSLERYASLGEKFDPNMHMALFKMPDPTKENDVVGAVTKEGYTLHGRVIRSAEVGVVHNG